MARNGKADSRGDVRAARRGLARMRLASGGSSSAEGAAVDEGDGAEPEPEPEPPAYVTRYALDMAARAGGAVKTRPRDRRPASVSRRKAA